MPIASYLKNYVIISPYSKRLHQDRENPKNYPYFREVIDGLYKNKLKVIQLGVTGELKLDRRVIHFLDADMQLIKEMIMNSFCWISVDNFFQHLIMEEKRGIVIWGISNPDIFGYKNNINLLKDKKYLRVNQFQDYMSESFNKDCWIEPSKVVEAVLCNECK